jgi:hypothetical protein
MSYRTNRQTKGTFFIHTAIKNPGALRNYVANTFGTAGFNTDGTIRPFIIEKLASGHCPVCAGTPKTCVCPTKITKQRARLAKTLRSFHK